jgi:hypothetical protein
MMDKYFHFLQYFYVYCVPALLLFVYACRGKVVIVVSYDS